jgi:RimM protein, required for 16S rRNA processing
MSDSPEFITVCQLMRTHGVKGHIKAMPLTHDITRHKSLKAVAVKKTNGEILDLEIEESRQAGNLWLLKFKGINTPERGEVTW